MATIEHWQAELSNPALVQSFATSAETVEIPTTVMRGTPPVATEIKVLVVTTPVKVLAKQASIALGVSISEDENSLGRLLKSEGYSGSVSEKARALIGIGQAIVRRARKRFPGSNRPVTDLLTYSSFQFANGKYGEQSGRVAATSQDPRPWHLMVAKDILSGALPDVAPNATSFLEAWQKGASQRGKALRDFIAVVTKWHRKDKLAWVGPVPGLSGKLLFFAKETDPGKRETALSNLVAWYKAHDFGAKEPSSEGH